MILEKCPFDDIRLDDNHTYWWPQKTPGVSEVLTRTGVAKYPETERLRDARLRGTRVHLAIKLLEKGTLNEDALDSDDGPGPSMREQKIVSYLDAYKRFRDDKIDKILASEWKIGHLIFRYCGTLDMLAITRDGRLVVMDWKTGKPPWWVELQTGAYLEAILSAKDHFELQSDELWHGAVQLNSNGTYKEPSFSRDRDSFGVFRQALSVVNFCDRKAI